MPATSDINENSPLYMTYLWVTAAGMPIRRIGLRPGADADRKRSDMTMAISNELSYPRPLTADEHDLIEAMLGAVRSGVSRYMGQLEAAEVVGGCGCGCPSIRPRGRVGGCRRWSVSCAPRRRRVPRGRSGWCDPVGAWRVPERARGPSLGWHRCHSAPSARNLAQPPDRQLIRFLGRGTNGPVVL